MTPEKAVEAVQELLTRWLGKSPDGVAFGRFFHNLEMLSPARLRALYDPSKDVEFVKLIEDAHKGSPAAEAELNAWGALAVSGAGNIPLPLRKYVADKLLEQAEAGRRRRGQNPDQFLPRNFIITYAVARVSEHEFHPTRNRETDSQQSACSIVAEALKRVRLNTSLKKRMRLNTSEDNVEKIWEGRSQLPEHLREYIEGQARIPTGSLLEAPASEQ